MKADEPWTLLRAQRIEEGLKAMQKELGAKPTPSHIMEMGAAYMWAERYSVAKDHFQTAIAQYHGNMSSFYGMAGSSMWCLGEFDEAVASWRAGLDAEFTDTAGLGIRIPLLLSFASMVRPNTFESTEAMKLLGAKCKDSRIKEWPGPIARFIVGAIGESELSNQSKCDSADETADRQWQIEFYKAVTNLEKTSRADFRSTLLKLADTSKPEWADDEFFLARMWSEEFFLAKSCASGDLSKQRK